MKYPVVVHKSEYGNDVQMALWLAVQELTKENNKLKAENDMLEARLDNLERRIALLESQ